MKAIRDQLLRELQSEGRDHATVLHVLPVDLSSRTSCEEAVKSAVALMGGLDYLILNHITSADRASQLAPVAVAEGTDFDEPTHILTINTLSYIWLTRAALPTLLGSNGNLVVVSSLAGHIGVPRTALYAASKHALHGFFDALRVELAMANEDVAVTLCAIGATDTEGAAPAKARLTSIQWDPPEAAAEAIVRGGATRQREIFHPHRTLFPVVVLRAFVPSIVDRILMAVYQSG